MNAQDFANKLRDLGWERVRTDYSGRCMFGTTCVAVDISTIEDLFRLGMQLGEAGVEVRAPRVDNMGKGAVAYWPELKTREARILSKEEL